MMQENGKWFAFDDYDDELLTQRITYWETQGEYFDGVLQAMYDERDRRFQHKMLAWVEQK